MAERDLPGQPEQDVEPDADDRGQRDQRQNEMACSRRLSTPTATPAAVSARMASGIAMARGGARASSDLVHRGAAEQAVRHEGEREDDDA